MASFSDLHRDLPIGAAHPATLAFLLTLAQKVDEMSLNLSNLQAAVAAAVAKLDAPLASSAFTQATQDAAVAAQVASDASAQATVDAANQAEVDAMTSDLEAAHATAA